MTSGGDTRKQVQYQDWNAPTGRAVAQEPLENKKDEIADEISYD